MSVIVRCPQCGYDWAMGTPFTCIMKGGECNLDHIRRVLAQPGSEKPNERRIFGGDMVITGPPS
jgi:hypothetical protein